jgi:magnesium chelatase subunit D
MAIHTDPAQLTDTIDPFESLRVGRPVLRTGLLAQARGGFLVVAMAERLPTGLAAALAQAIDRGDCGLVLLDESLPDEPPVASALRDRMGCSIDMRDETLLREAWMNIEMGAAMDAAMAATTDWQSVHVPEPLVQAVMEASQLLGLVSLRPSLACLRWMRMHACSHGRTEATAEDLAWAVPWSLLPQARQWPSPPPEDATGQEQDQEATQNTQSPEEAQPDHGSPPETPTPQKTDDFEERTVETAAASLPKGLLEAWARGLAQQALANAGGSGAGRMGEGGRGRGRPVGVIRRKPRGGEDRLAILPTLRAAIPFQSTRTRSHTAMALRPDDLHVWRLKRQRGVTTVFVVDASGSAAMARLAEAKGAIEILLSECYSRRDRVALIAFGGRGAELRLPPTRSLVAARKSLTALVGGGGSPIAAGFAMAAEQLTRLRLVGDDTCLVVLSDGRANLARDGSPGRPRAMEEAMAMARKLSLLAPHRLLIDTSARPEPAAVLLSQAMSAQYLALPMAGAKGIHKAIQSVRRAPTEA